mgnify:CR=1 FL=1
MLKLRWSPASPFARKVCVAAELTGLSDRIELITTDTLNPEDPLRKDNPLGKIPCLILENGSTLYDSRVIVEYFDHEAGGGILFPKDWQGRLATLKLQALADGILDAALLQLYEGRFRQPEKHEPSWIAYQGGKVERGFAALEANLPAISAKPEIGAITVACMLEWIRFRFPGRIEAASPKLLEWLTAFNAAFPAFAKSAPRV